VVIDFPVTSMGRLHDMWRKLSFLATGDSVISDPVADYPDLESCLSNRSRIVEEPYGHFRRF
jgi:hypothetical protein